MAQNAIETTFGELLHLNLLEEFEPGTRTWTREKLAAAYERALFNTMRDGAPTPPEGSIEAILLRLPAHARSSGR